MFSLFKREKNFFDRVFDDFYTFTLPTSNFMKTDIKEFDTSYTLEIELPGYKKEDIKVSLNEGYLLIEAETNLKNDAKDDTYLRKERYYGNMKRKYYVGGVDLKDLKGHFENGILTVEIPKDTKESTEKKYLDLQ